MMETGYKYQETEKSNNAKCSNCGGIGFLWQEFPSMYGEGMNSPVVCADCRGSGLSCIGVAFGNKKVTKYICKNCEGTGRIDRVKKLEERIARLEKIVEKVLQDG